MAFILKLSFSVIFLSFFLLSSTLDMSIITYDNEHNLTKPGCSDDEVKVLYESWIHEHDKVYNAIGEKEKRFEIFKENLKLIDERNSVKRSYKLGLTRFADITNEEFRAMYLSPQIMDPKVPSGEGKRHAFKTRNELPKSVDWREKGAVGPIRDEGLCKRGSWAFAATAAVESANQIATGNFTSLSVQQLLDCDKSSLGCVSGNIINGYDYIIENGGIATEKSYPYRGVLPGFCKKSSNFAVLSHYVLIRVFEEYLTEALVDQPVTAVMDAGGLEFQLYESGIFDGHSESYYQYSVTIVGYGEEETKTSNDDITLGNEYYIVAFSYGKDWGEDGYMKLKRNTGNPVGMCGIARQASYPAMDVYA